MRKEITRIRDGLICVIAPEIRVIIFKGDKMKKPAILLAILLASLFITAQAPLKLYRVNIFNFYEEFQNIKEVAIANDRIYFFSALTNQLSCYGTVDKKRIWQTEIKGLKMFRKYYGLSCDKLGRCIIVAPQEKGVKVLEFSNLGHFAGEHVFPDIDGKAGKFLLLNGKMLYAGKEVGELKTKLIFTVEERKKIADAVVKTGRPVRKNALEWQVPVALEVEGIKLGAFNLTLKYKEPVIVVSADGIRADNAGRIYIHTVFAKELKHGQEENAKKTGSFRNELHITDISGRIILETDPVDAVVSMITVDDDGKVCEVYRMFDTDKKLNVYRVYYWYIGKALQ